MRRLPVLLFALGASAFPLAAQKPAATSTPDGLTRWLTALEGDTPLLRDLQQLVDEIGGRATGSAANVRSVDWALAKFAEAGVTARKESFTMPTKWLERSARATVKGAGIEFAPRIASMPFSVATSAAGITAPLVDVARGTEADFKRVGGAVKGAYILVEQPLLLDVDGLFKEYAEASQIEARAFDAGVAGVVYQGSRPNDLLYRHGVTIATKNTRPMVVMERDAASRALRLMRAGKSLSLTLTLDLDIGGPYESWNVVAEIPGTTKKDEIVLVGAHLDSWDLGGGALDNGANVAMLIDLARQLKKTGAAPARTIRFALWNGEEQMMIGSWGYAKSHAAELDKHVMASAFDIGCGRITGFFTGARPELVPALKAALAPVAGRGPFDLIDAPIVGTDNYDFMLQGVANIVGNQAPAEYGPNYHARSDEFDRCDGSEVRRNAGIVAAVTWGIANGDVTWKRQSRADIEAMMKRTDLVDQMKSFALYDEWTSGLRGRPAP
jgi:hypothetical protein